MTRIARIRALKVWAVRPERDLVLAVGIAGAVDLVLAVVAAARVYPLLSLAGVGAIRKTNRKVVGVVEVRGSIPGKQKSEHFATKHFGKSETSPNIPKHPDFFLGAF